MTYQGAIDELKSLENNESMPDWFKPTLKKVRETMEMDGRENIDGEWIEKDTPDAYRWKCSCCGLTRHCKENFCPNCGADMREVEE